MLYPSDKQLQFAQSLGIIVLPNMTSEQVSDQIDCNIEQDVPAQDIFKKIANSNGVPCSSYTGSKNLRNRIFRSFSRPTKERLLVRWFAFFVMLDRKVMTMHDDDIWSKPELLAIAEKLEANHTVIKSIHRYADNDLMFFGKQISSDGSERAGSSKDTAAYKAITELL